MAQECKALNPRLVSFVKQPKCVAKLLEYVVQPAPRNADDKRHSKYPFASCEVQSTLDKRVHLDNRFIVQPAPRNADDKRHSKYHFASCEVSFQTLNPIPCSPSHWSPMLEYYEQHSYPVSWVIYIPIV